MELNVSLKEALDWFLGSPLRILIILVLAIILQKIASRAITKTLSRVAEADFIPGEKTSVTRQRERARTAASVLNSSSKALIGLIAGAMILGELGVDLGPQMAKSLKLEINLKSRVADSPLSELPSQDNSITQF